MIFLRLSESFFNNLFKIDSVVYGQLSSVSLFSTIQSNNSARLKVSQIMAKQQKTEPI